MKTPAVVMNLFYTGLGVARSLGERGVPVIGLTSGKRIYGNYTRYAKVVHCADSRAFPERLLPELIDLGKTLECRAVIFPTRDEDVQFLDRFRKDLEPYFILTVPESGALQACLNKWDTYLWAQRAGVDTPRSWLIESREDLVRAMEEAAFPCVVKPLTAPQWRTADNWRLVGGRKAFAVDSPERLLVEYTAIARADARMLLQEMVPGDDDRLRIAACYFNRQSEWVAGFNTRKLIQTPEGFGTGCIVQASSEPQLFEPTRRLLTEMGFTGIAEVEYKWDEASGRYKLIEINPRPWDQHRLGGTFGVDLVYLAYCEHAGLPMPAVEARASEAKWIAEDVFWATALRLLIRGNSKFFSLFRLARGRRIYAVWSARDPVPWLASLLLNFLPGLAVLGGQAIRSAWNKRIAARRARRKEGPVYDKRLEDRNHAG